MTHLEYSSTQSPLIINYPQSEPLRPLRGVRVPTPSPAMRNERRQKRQAGLLAGKRRPAKPLHVLRQREPPRGIATRMGAAYKEAISWFQERRKGAFEGPQSLRAITFFGGAACTITSLVALCHAETFLTSFPVAALLVYQFLFGLAAMTIEAKNLKMFEALQPWLHEWFPFLSVPLGKGFLYILMGVLGLSIWQSHVFVSTAGGFMCLMGLLYICVYFGWKKHLERVGLELTTHPGRSNMGDAGGVPRLGAHREKHQLVDHVAHFGDNDGDDADDNDEVYQPRETSPADDRRDGGVFQRDPYRDYRRIPMVPAATPMYGGTSPRHRPDIYDGRDSGAVRAPPSSHEQQHNVAADTPRWVQDHYPIEFLDGISRYQRQQEQAAAW